ncbi:MAG: hypothetical protein ABSF74_08860 [Dehalococcoidia bacterium]|jgi:hypothetical protein
MKISRYLIVLAGLLILSSVILFVIDYMIFRDLRNNLFYLIQDLAFLPLQVLLVGVIVEGLLARREVEEKISKMNMVVGTFFSEVGHRLSTMLLEAADDKTKIMDNLHVVTSWKQPEFNKALDFARKETQTQFPGMDLGELKAFLVSKRTFLLALIENPNLLEHERFTDLLLSVFHLTEELESRPSLANLPPKDMAHIGVDISRAYQYLLVEWLDYMQHLKANYPFLYSHYLRIHPFQPHPSAIVE